MLNVHRDISEVMSSSRKWAKASNTVDDFKPDSGPVLPSSLTWGSVT